MHPSARSPQQDRAGVLRETGLGAASADAVYVAIAGFGLTGDCRFLVGHERTRLRVAGGLFLIVLGVARTGRTPPAAGRIHQHRWSTRRGLSRPPRTARRFPASQPPPITATIVSFVAIFVGLGIAGQWCDARPSRLVAVFCQFSRIQPFGARPRRDGRFRRTRAASQPRFAMDRRMFGRRPRRLRLLLALFAVR
jgi:hypothetical protein